MGEEGVGEKEFGFLPITHTHYTHTLYTGTGGREG